MSIKLKQNIDKLPKLPKLPKYPKPYPQFGFESTWRLTNVELQTQIDNRENYPYPNTELLTNNNGFNLEYKKLTQWEDVSNDPHNIEIPSKIIKNKNKLLADFKRLSKLLNKFGCIESSRSFNNHWEGGGHIHIDYGKIFGDLGGDYSSDHGYYVEYFDYFLNRINFKLIRSYTKYNDNRPYINNLFASFTSNLFNFIINNPWIPWAFNAPNDNDSAKNNLLNKSLDKDIKHIANRGLENTGNILIDCKDWAIVLRPELQTFEFRFFGMPKNEKELSLHIDLAQAIYKYCFYETINGHVIKKKFSNNKRTGKLLKQITYNESISGLKKACKLLNINYSLLIDYGKINNLQIRYAYHKAVMDSEDYNNPEAMILN